MCLMVACNTLENPIPETSDAVVYIKADSEEDITKGSVDGDDATFTWNTGDRIAVYTKSGYVISRALSSADDGEASANFPFSSTGNYALVQADREDFAIFPTSLVWDGNAIRTSSATNHDAANLTLTLPARYELSQVQNNVSPTPMIATNVENGALAFKALCPLLRLTVNNIPKQTKRIEFDFNGKKVQGEFTLTDVVPGTTAITTSATAGTDDIITVTMAGNTTWHDYLIFNLPVPAGTYGDITITAYDATSGGNAVLKLTKALKVSGAAWEPTRKSSGKMTATLPVFSVADGKKVTFAPGNLYTDGEGNLHMGSTYYDHIYAFSSNGDYANADTYKAINRTHFNYNETYYLMNKESLDKTKAYTDRDAAYSLTRNDIGGGNGQSWRVPTRADWCTLTTGDDPGSDRSGAKVRNGSSDTYTDGWKFIKVLVSGMSGNGTTVSPDEGTTISALASDATGPSTNYQAGLLLFPDNEEITGIFGSLGTQNDINANSNFTTITKTNLDALIDAGCAFLPAVGRLDSVFGYVGIEGYYWSCSRASAVAGCSLVFFDGNKGVRPKYEMPTPNKSKVFRSVRLICDLN